MSDELDLPSVSIHVIKRQNQRLIGAALNRKICGTIVDENEDSPLETNRLGLYEFVDNDQFSNLDSLLNQVGNVLVYLSDEFQDFTKGDGRKLHNLFESKSLEVIFLKKSCFSKKPETQGLLLKLVGNATHATNIVETERPVAFGCLECLMHALRLREDTDNFGRFSFHLDSLNNCMRLDTAAADAVNLLPKADHPSQFGSLFGILNRCKTKMGSRLLDRCSKHSAST